MKKEMYHLIVYLVFIFLLVLNQSCIKKSEDISDTIVPFIAETGKYNAVITWTSSKPYRGRIFYRSEKGYERSIREESAVKKHRLIISGLMPETLYYYGFSKKGNTKFSFKTAPRDETPFRVMVYQKDFIFRDENMKILFKDINEYLPDFVILAGKLSCNNFINESSIFFNKITKLKIPIFLLSFSNEFPENEHNWLPENRSGFYYSFDYGNSTFVILMHNGKYKEENTIKWLEERLGSEKEHVFVVCDPFEYKNPEVQILLKRNNRSIIITSKINADSKNDSIILLNEQFSFFDIDGQGITSTTGRPGESDYRIRVIRDIPASARRSCIYCRKLIESKKYKESIKWYRNFISDFGDKYLIDDAQYEIANLYDRYLFDYDYALKEYNIFKTKFPDNFKRKQVESRIEYLKKYSDNGFVPLQIFERAKTITYQKDKMKAVEEMEVILNNYPESKLKKEILYWLGHFFSEQNYKKSVSLYNELLNESLDTRKKIEVFTALGDTCYIHKKYRKAIQYYQSAINMYNKEKSSVNNKWLTLAGIIDKVRKCKRNIVRLFVLILLISIFVLLIAAALFKSPILMTKYELVFIIKSMAALLIIYIFVWLIFFRAYRRLLIFGLTISPMIAIIPSVIGSLVRKYLNPDSGKRNIFIIILLILLFNIISFYIYLYFYHYLPVFGI